jgi:nucleotide-binding universal stress UspA family protein
MGYKAILVTLSGSKISELALQQVVRIAEPGAHLHLLSVVAENHVTEVADLASAIADTNEQLNEQWPHAAVERSPYKENARESYLNEIREWLEPAGYSVTTEISQGNIVGTILSVAKKGFEVIVMVTHGRTGIARTVIGSVTNAVLETTPCPMLVIRAPSAANM